MSAPYDFSNFVDERLLQGYGTLLCAGPDYTVGDMRNDYVKLRADWAAQLQAEGIHCVADAIAVYYNAAGGFDEDGHRDHPHIALRTFGLPHHG